MREVPSSSNKQTGPYAGPPLSPLGESQPPLSALRTSWCSSHKNLGRNTIVSIPIWQVKQLRYREIDTS